MTMVDDYEDDMENDEEAPHERKRQRSARPTSDDIIRQSRYIMHDDPFKERAPSDEARHFRALFGCCAEVTRKLWLMQVDNEFLPQGVTIKHLLWTLMFLKVYPTDRPMSMMTKADPKTFRKWIDLVLDAISFLEPLVVSSTTANCVPE
jgi:hypothetical protein